MVGYFQKGISMKWSLTFVFLFVISCAHAQPKSEEVELKSDLSKKISRLIQKSPVSASDLGILIKRKTDTGIKTVYSINSKKQLNPASLTKILTASTVLNTIALDHKFKTTLSSSAKVEDGVLKGDLYLVGGGDPGFVSESMWVLVNHFTRTGIKKVEGNIVVDDHFFDQQRFDPSRGDERVSRAYDSPIGAMSFNWNSVNVYIRPTQVGSLAQITLDPTSDYLNVRGEVKTVAPGKGTKVNVARIKNGENKNTILVSGRIESNDPEKVVYRSITHPDFWSGEQLKSFLKQRDISVTGQVVKGHAPNGAEVLAETESKPIAEIIKDIMKFSNNYVAEMMTKNLAAYKGHTPGNMAWGLQLIREQLEAFGLKDGKDFKLVNPSGLTRLNRVTPQAMVKVLDQIKNAFPIYPEYLSSLPIGGLDGTLKNRLKDVKGWVRAKTGLLSGVCGLAGYASNPVGLEYDFAMIYNGPNRHRWSAQKLFDEIAAELVTYRE